MIIHQNVIDKLIGSVLMGLGVSLAFTNMSH
jgi:hypothetical protein